MPKIASLILALAFTVPTFAQDFGKLPITTVAVFTGDEATAPTPTKVMKAKKAKKARKKTTAKAKAKTNDSDKDSDNDTARPENATK